MEQREGGRCAPGAAAEAQSKGEGGTAGGDSGGRPPTAREALWRALPMSCVPHW